MESKFLKRAYILFLILIIVAFISSIRIEVTHFEDSSGIIELNGNRVASYVLPIPYEVYDYMGIEFE